MPRSPRSIVPQVLVHVRSRFVDGRFEFDDRARSLYLERLDRVLADSDWVLISFALMSSHLHLGVISGHSDLGSWLHPLNTWIAGWLSARRRTRSPHTLGQVFGDRPGTNLLPLERAFPLISYHHNNPVEAGVVTQARQSSWTSHLQYIGSETQHVSALDTERGLELCAMQAEKFDAEVHRAAERPNLVDRTPGAIVGFVSGHFGLHYQEVAGGAKSRCAVVARRVALAIGAAWGHSAARMASALGISRAAAAKLRRTSSSDVDRIARTLVDAWCS